MKNLLYLIVNISPKATELFCMNQSLRTTEIRNNIINC